MTKDIIRQGDVLLVPAKVIPSTAVPVEAENGLHILARGEMTGHHHSIRAREGICMFRDDGAGGGAQYVSGLDGDKLAHQEHTALQTTAPVMRAIIQRTVQSGMARRVED